LLGATWSTSTPFYTLPGAFDRNRIFPTLDKHGFIFPCYNSSPDIDNSFILRLSSPTSNLTRIDMKDTDNLIQPTIIRLNNSARLRTFLRDEDAEWIYYLDSNDDGLTWTTPKPTSLPNNNAAIEAYTLKGETIIMAFNNHNGSQTPRAPLTVALSYDNGMTWPYHRDVQIHDDDNNTYIGEYSYPSLLQSFWSGTDHNDIHLAYSYNRKTIKYVRLNETWIKQGQEFL
jgi:predicted neuraminidase